MGRGLQGEPEVHFLWQILKCERIPGSLLTLLSSLQGLAYPLSAVWLWKHLTLLALGAGLKLDRGAGEHRRKSWCGGALFFLDEVFVEPLQKSVGWLDVLNLHGFMRDFCDLCHPCSISNEWDWSCIVAELVLDYGFISNWAVIDIMEQNRTESTYPLYLLTVDVGCELTMCCRWQLDTIYRWGIYVDLSSSRDADLVFV